MNQGPRRGEGRGAPQGSPSPPAPLASWLAEEAPLAGAASATTRRLIRRAAASWPVWGVAALLLAGVLTLMRARVPPRYDATILLRVTEGTVTIAGAQLGAGSLRAHLNELVFTRKRLTGLMQRHPQRFPDLVQDQATALEDFRDRMTIDITETNFTEERSPEDPPRWARLRITFTSIDPEFAFTVAQELSDLVIGSTLTKKREELEAEQQAALAAVTSAEADLARIAGGPVAPPPGLAQAARERTMLAKQGLTAAVLALRALSEGQSLKFTVIDPGRVPPRVGTTAALATGLLSTLLAALVAGVLLAGAYDPRVLDVEDLSDLGTSALGRLPALPRRARRPGKA